MTREKQKTSTDTLEVINRERQLVLHNDDFNTFDFVIQTLIEVCEHDVEQAEQCAWIVHFNGKCAVKSGDYEDLKPRYETMKNKSLTVTIK
jgi:ATP-dependent Clp protease adaptor protein ClpS